jgi:DNA (cytosine-5)-methyltransferase 1
MSTDLRPKAITLFSGLGSSSKALRDLGYQVLAHDIMPEAVATLRANGFDACLANVKEIDYSDPRYSDVEWVIGGPPCQPFSQAHQGDGEYDERDMIPEFIRAVAEVLPKGFIMEEVKTLTWKRHAAYLERVETDLRALGYRVEHRVLNAADHGIGQARKRLFIVGIREDVALRWEAHGIDAIQWPDTSLYQPVTMAEALGWTRDEAVRRAHAAPRYGTPDWVFEKPAPTVVGSFRPDVAAKPGWRKPGDGPRQNTPGSVVTTLEERLKLQDMPADWNIAGSKAKQDLQVGNSVPCGLIRDLIDINIP